MFGIINTPANASADQKSHYGRRSRGGVPRDARARADLPAHALAVGPIRGFAQASAASAAWSSKPWDERERSISQIVPEVQAKLSAIPGLADVRGPARPRCRAAATSRSSSSSRRRREPEEMLEFAQQLQMKAMESGVFWFPPEIDLKYDQPQSEIVIDHDKVAALGLEQRAGRRRPRRGARRQLRQPLQHRRPRYKVIPQIERAERLNPDQLQDIYVTGPDGELMPLSSIATMRDKTVPRSLNRFQQLNAIKLSGMTAQLDAGLKALESRGERDPAARLHDRLHGRVAAAAHEGGKFLPALGLAIVMIFLVLAAQFNSFRDPLVILLGSVPLAMFGALIFTFLKMPERRPALLHRRLDDDDEHLRAGRARHARRPRREERHPHRRVRQQAAGARARASSTAVKEAAMTRLRPVLMTTVATVAGHFPLTLVDGPGRRGAQLDRPRARRRHDDRHALHALRGAVALRADRQGPSQAGFRRGGALDGHARGRSRRCDSDKVRRTKDRRPWPLRSST